MGLLLAWKAFCKALSQPEEAKKFLEPSTPKIEQQDPSHLRLLTHLQQSGRLIDFLKEDISAFSDAQIGAAVRKIHADCGKILEEYVTIRAVLDQEEGTPITIPQGYDPSLIKIIGKVKGEPPFKGTIVHKGWKAHKRSLPKTTNPSTHADILCPAEVEIH